MKKIILTLMVTLIVACQSSREKYKELDYRMQSQKVNEVKESSTGQVFYFDEFMKGQPDYIERLKDQIFHGSNGRVELSIAAVRKDSVSLRVKHYFKPSRFEGPNKYFLKSDTWHVKPGLTEEFEYNIKTSKIISYKELKFQIISVSDSGVIKYKRTK